MPSKGTGELVVPDPPLEIPALRDDGLNFAYAIAHGEMGVLSSEPDKSIPLDCSDCIFPDLRIQASYCRTGHFEQCQSQRTQPRFSGRCLSRFLFVETLLAQLCRESSSK